jgi:pseudomonalisin/xanthomonalisin
MTMAASVSAAPASNAVASTLFATVNHATQLHTGDQVVGLLSQAQPMHVAVSLKLRNKTQLDAFVADPHHANLTPAQFAETYAPTQAQAQAVANYLTKAGFSNVTIAPNRQLVTATGRADTTAAAFQTSFVRVRTHDGRDAYANSGDVKIPAALQSTVQEVLGLQNVHIYHTLARPLTTSSVQTNASGTMSVHNPTDFPAIYNVGSTATGSTVSVGIVTEGSMTNTQSDFSKFLTNNPSLGNIPLNVVTVDGGSTDTSGDLEWAIDTQDIAGMSGGVKSLTLYDTSSLATQPLLDAFNTAVTDNTVRIINVSIGGCESGAAVNGADTGDNIFEQAVAQGQTFSIATGDTGSNECGDGTNTVSWPANSQYVVAVGGTNLYTTGTTYDSEAVWSTAEGAGGGGVSTFEAQPSWQKSVGANTGSNYRGMPDIAMEAAPESGAILIVDGNTESGAGGTSLASPLFVGVWARVLATKPSLGFAAPLIYADAAKNYAADFHDVTSGNNAWQGSPGETAAVGWDYASGFGSLNIANFVANVAGGGSTGGTPTANFTDTTSGLTATFTDSSTDSGGTISAHAWTFGDGSTSTATSPSHTYAAAGTYSVTETVTDSVSGKTSAKTASVTVSSGGTTGKPVANFTDAVSGLTANFTNSSTDTGGTISSYAWTFGDGGTSTSASPSHTYAAAGTYTVTLKVTDNTGATNTKSGSVTVTAPTGRTFSSNTAVAIGDDATVTSPITVSGISGDTKSTIQVHVNIASNMSGDLGIEITAPDGSTATLKGPDFTTTGSLNTTYSVTASGVVANGTWTLTVIDYDYFGNGDHGTLNSWNISL